MLHTRDPNELLEFLGDDPTSTFAEVLSFVQQPGRLQPFPGSLGSARVELGSVVRDDPWPGLRVLLFGRFENDLDVGPGRRIRESLRVTGRR